MPSCIPVRRFDFALLVPNARTHGSLSPAIPSWGALEQDSENRARMASPEEGMAGDRRGDSVPARPSHRAAGLLRTNYV